MGDQVAAGANPINSSDMEQLEVTNHPFIVRIWLEEPAGVAGRAMWRGQIIHVPSNTKGGLQDLEDIATFIVPYLEQMGVKFGLAWQVKQWLKRQKRSLRTRA